MRRLVLVVVILVVHCIALLCAAGAPDPMQLLGMRSLQTPPASAPAPTTEEPPAQPPSNDPPANESDSTYEQYRRDRDQAAEAQAAASADAAPAPAELANPFHIQINLDFTNAYFYRGILQQDHGLITQPAAKLTIDVLDHDGWSVDAFLGTWNSFGRNGGSNTNNIVSDWYESDLVAGFAITKDKFSLTTSYIFLTSPADAFATVQELDFALGFDDSEALGKFALHPYALLAIETSSVGSDGADPGIYLELGVAPGFSFNLGKTPVAVSFPVVLGLSLDDYYQDAGGTGDDSTFGFVQAGAKVAVPLPFGERFGQWTLNAGVAGMYLGDNLAEVNGDDNFEVIGTIGLQWNF